MSVQSQIKSLSLRHFKRLAVQNQGTRHSRQRGGNMDYEESRAYVVGDDIKTMDWRVMARTGEAHTKIFSHEQEKSIILAVDMSSSMYFGTQHSFKSWTAAQIAAHIGWLVKASDDKLGATVINDSKPSIIKPSGNRKVLLNIFKALCESKPAEADTTTESTLDILLYQLNGQSLRGSIVFLISDFLGVTSSTLTMLKQLERNNDICAFWVHDRTEVDPWPNGNFPVRQESQINMLDTTNPSTRSWLRDRQAQHRQNVDKLISNCRFKLCEISCNDDLAAQLTPFLHHSDDL